MNTALINKTIVEAMNAIDAAMGNIRNTAHGEIQMAAPGYTISCDKTSVSAIALFHSPEVPGLLLRINGVMWYPGVYVWIERYDEESQCWTSLRPPCSFGEAGYQILEWAKALPRPHAPGPQAAESSFNSSSKAANKVQAKKK